MFLLSDRLVEHYMFQKQISIDKFAPESLELTSYYFRLSHQVEMYSSYPGELVDLRKRSNTLVLDPGESAKVQSVEYFRVQKNVMMQIGNHSKQINEKAVALHHGISIDPGYSGPLFVTLTNIGNEAASIEVGDRIGKLLFFDISDTGLLEASMQSYVAERSQQADGRSR